MSKLSRVTSAALIGALSLALGAGALWSQEMGDMDMGEGGGGSGAISQMGAHMHMGPHMTMTPSKPLTPEDAHRGEQILRKMREALVKYEDYKVAITDGYKPFMEHLPQDVYHFSNTAITAQEYLGAVEIEHPGSLLYEKKTFGGYKLVGAMYSAGEDETPAQLNEIIPLSVGSWHAHTNICLPKDISMKDILNGDVKAGAHYAGKIDTTRQTHGSGRGTEAVMRYGYLADPRFGFEGTIADPAECESAGGAFHKQIFGWMIHVYPFHTDDLKVAFSMEAP